MTYDAASGTVIYRSKMHAGLKRNSAAARASQVEMLTPRLGEMINADQPFPLNPWWKAVR